ncbi:Histidine--tRNA ligase [Clostridiales bacterium CHKCI006]|nr:Histidine--tRNA ligase [Clostridiales bacterium CHKCI006]
MAYTAPRGTVDLLPQDTRKWQYLEQLLRTIADLYNVKEIRPPMFEHTELFNRSVGDTSDIVTKEMYTFADKKGRSLTLRPEGTAGVARAYVENKLFAAADKPVKLYYMGPMFRYERPQKGRQRQFHQFGVEMLGVEDPALDVEAMLMAVTIVQSLGLKNVRLVVNTLGDAKSRQAHKEALKKHFEPYLGELCHDCQERFEKNPLRILDCKVDHDHPAMKNAPRTIDYLTDEAKAYFDQVLALLDDLEVSYVVDPNLVRGLDYYCHVVFEVISDDPILGAQSTLGGGGRYNSLIEELGGPATPGIGFAFGMERLVIALGDQLEEEEEHLDVYLMPLGEKGKNLAVQIQAMLRANGLSCDMDYQNRSMKAQFKTVDRMKANFAIIIGDDEVDQEVVNIKDTRTRNQETVALEDILAYLEKKMEE